MDKTCATCKHNKMLGMMCPHSGAEKLHVQAEQINGVTDTKVNNNIGKDIEKAEKATKAVKQPIQSGSGKTANKDPKPGISRAAQLH